MKRKQWKSSRTITELISRLKSWEIKLRACLFKISIRTLVYRQHFVSLDGSLYRYCNCVVHRIVTPRSKRFIKHHVGRSSYRRNILPIVLFTKKIERGSLVNCLQLKMDGSNETLNLWPAENFSFWPRWRDWSLKSCFVTDKSPSLRTFPLHRTSVLLLRIVLQQ